MGDRAEIGVLILPPHQPSSVFAESTHKRSSIPWHLRFSSEAIHRFGPARSWRDPSVWSRGYGKSFTWVPKWGHPQRLFLHHIKPGTLGPLTEDPASKGVSGDLWIRNQAKSSCGETLLTMLTCYNMLPLWFTIISEAATSMIHYNPLMTPWSGCPTRGEQ